MIKIRLAEMEDFEFFYNLKCEKLNIFWTGHKEKPERENLHKFFVNAVNNAVKKETRKIFIIENDNDKVGHIYIIPDENNDVFAVSIALSENYVGHGYAKKAIELGFEIGIGYGYKKAIAFIREDNIRSINSFTSSGFKLSNYYEMRYIPNLEKEVKMFIFEKIYSKRV